MHQEEGTTGDIRQTPKTQFPLWSSQVSDSRQGRDALISHSRHLPRLPLSRAPLYFMGPGCSSGLQRFRMGAYSESSCCPPGLVSSTRAACFSEPWICPGVAGPDVGCSEGVRLGQLKEYPGNRSIYSVQWLYCCLLHSPSVWNSLIYLSLEYLYKMKGYYSGKNTVRMGG